MKSNKFKAILVCIFLFLLLVFPTIRAAQAEECKPITFTNNSDEDIFIGVWHGGSEGLKEKTGFQPPADFPDWKLPKGQSRDWCVPQGFSGRIIARTGCNDQGKCIAGDCCSDEKGGKCLKNVCTSGNDSGSVAEFTLDNWVSAKPADWMTWYDPSYVDGYNFPIKIDFETQDGATCKSLGCDKINACPWNDGELVDGVCLAPYKKYEMEHPDFQKQQAYYVLAAKCAQSQKGICGCGNQCRKDNLIQCPDNYNITPTINIKSAGCSPLGLNDVEDDGVTPKNPTYLNDKTARDQITCATRDDKLDVISYKWWKEDKGCKFQWDDYDKDAGKYVETIKKTCPNSYSWQYDDRGGLASCKTAGIKKIKVTFFSRIQAKNNLKSMRIAQADGLTGMVKVSNNEDKNYGYSLSFSARKDTEPVGIEDIVRIKVKNGDKVTVTDNCGLAAAKRTCIMTYNEKVGLIPEGTILRDGRFIPNPNDENDAKKADENCYGSSSGYSWNTQKPEFLAMGLGNGVCEGSPYQMQLAPVKEFKGRVKVNNATVITFPETTSFNIKKGDIVVIEDNRGDNSENFTRSCTMKYDVYEGTKEGLIPQGTMFKNGKFVKNDDPNDNKNAKPECYNIECSGYQWDRQNRINRITTLPMVMPKADRCGEEVDANFTLYPLDNTEGSYMITDNVTGKNGETVNYGPLGEFCKDRSDCRKNGFLKIKLNEFDTLTLTTRCNVGGKADPDNTKMTCIFKYDSKNGLSDRSEKCGDQKVSNIDWRQYDYPVDGKPVPELHYGMPNKERANDKRGNSCIK